MGRSTAGILLALLAAVVAANLGRACFGPPPDPPAKPEEKEPADNSFCYVCHLNYQKEELTTVHEAAGVGCEKCHGPSIKHSGDEDGLIPPDVLFPKDEINKYCLGCHPQDKISREEQHKKFFATGIKEKQTCTDCHGKNHRLKVRTRVWDKKTRKLLSDDGVRMMKKQAEPKKP